MRMQTRAQINKRVTGKSTLAVAMTLLVGGFAPAAMAEEVTAYNAVYEITRGGSNYGEAHRKVKLNEDDSYTLYTVTDISWLFLSDKREHQARFTVYEDKVQPLTFSYKRTGTGSDKAFSAIFDAEEKTVIDAESEETLSITWGEDLLDEASMLQQLQFDLENMQNNQGNGDDSETREFTYRVVDEKGQEDDMRFQLQETVTLDLPYGEVEALQVARIRDASSPRETLYWFAPELNYSIVRMKQWKDGDEHATMELKSYEVTN